MIYNYKMYISNNKNYTKRKILQNGKNPKDLDIQFSFVPFKRMFKIYDRSLTFIN